MLVCWVAAIAKKVEASLSDVRTGEITTATRTVEIDGVKVKTGDGADVIVRTPHELRIFGAITSSDVMELTAGNDQNYNERTPVNASIHLTGQLTSLADNSLLRLEGPDDILIEGSIFVRGKNSGLLVDSQKMVSRNYRILEHMAADS